MAFRSGRKHHLFLHKADERAASFSQIKVDSLFANYRIQSNADNMIAVNFSTEALLAALKSASASSTATSSFETEDIVLKLAKKSDQAVLSFEISGLTRVGRRIRVGHDVRIEVMKPADVARLSEPLCPEPDVSYSLLGKVYIWL